MTDTDIRDALTKATGHLSPAPDLLDRVRAGGRQRVVRRRAVLGGALAVAAAAGIVPALRPGKETAPADPPRVRGDLGHDQALVERVRDTWRKFPAWGGPGDVNVQWVGSTPEGPVAVVTGPSPSPNLELLGFVETVDGKLQVADGQIPVDKGQVTPATLLTGPRRDLLVVFAGDAIVSFSANYTFDEAGRLNRNFEDLRPDDGATLVRILEKGRFGVRQGRDQVPLLNADSVIDQPQQRSMPALVERAIPGRQIAPLAGAEKAQWNLSSREDYLDPYGYHRWTGPTEWYLTGSLPDGRRLVVQTLALDGKGRAFWLAGAPGAEPEVHYLGAPKEGLATKLNGGGNTVMPILYLRLPGQLGVAVAAAKCTLRYRAGGGDWLPVAGEAALLPDAATELRVEYDNLRSATFPIP